MSRLLQPDGFGACPVRNKHCFIASGLHVAICSRCFHAASRFVLVSSSRASSSWNLSKHSSKSSGSTSEKIFRTLSVKLRTAWFQWFLAFFSNAGKTIGSITLRFCLIRFSI
ncbi:UNVERIFIED_CONTAM: hypothetical protein Sradi_3039900 [Sesamum radiatum]|uniref:Uncharacterized protein n=1 Tax=Sesamum radiatum TaxID=300843 RepID=A0AAW2RBF3_SESRA